MSADEHVSRRDFFRLRFGGGSVESSSAVKPMAQLKASSADRPASSCRNVIPVIRPPGAINEPDFLDRCTSCGDCLRACPHDAIQSAPSRFRLAAGTPIINATTSPCRMCDDTPCISACQTEALASSPGIYPIGEARISTFDCIAHQTGFCTVCSEQCPVEGAIEIVDNRPHILRDRCTGCGVCHYVCPAPHNAIIIMPRPIETSPSDDSEC